MTQHHFILAALVLLLGSSGRVYSQCSIVSLEGPDTVTLRDVLKITAKVSSNGPNQPQFKWYISAGTITSDPQASTILIETAGLGGQSITTTVKIVGIETDCSTEATLVTRIEGPTGCGMAFDEYGDITYRDEKARLDNFAIQVLNIPGSRFHHRPQIHGVFSQQTNWIFLNRTPSQLHDARSVESKRATNSTSWNSSPFAVSTRHHDSISERSRCGFGALDCVFMCQSQYSNRSPE